MDTRIVDADRAQLVASPARRLPDDIIYEVFYALAKINPPRTPMYKSVYGKTAAGSLGWIIMTHVCKRWRRIGLDMAALWAEIVCMFPSGVETIARRTRDTPLQLNCSRTDNEMWDTIVKLDLLPRAKTLERYQIPSLERRHPVRDWPLTLMNQHLPQLQDLSLHLDVFTDVGRAQKTPLFAPALKSLAINVPFAIKAPSLTALEAVGDTWPMKVLLEFLKLYPTLTKLNIESISGDKEDWEADVPDQLMETIEQMDDQITTGSPVCLPHLQTLMFDYAGLQAAELLQRLHLPVITKLSVDYVWQRPDLAAVLLHAKLCSIPCNVLTISDWGEEHTPIIFLTDGDPYLGHTTNFPRGVMIQYHRDDPANELPFILKSIHSPGSIQTLALEHDCSFCDDWPCGGLIGVSDRGWLVRSLQRFRNLTTLELIGHEVAQNVPILVGGSSTELTLPALRDLILTLYGIALRTWWSNLQDALLARQNAHHQLDRLVIRSRGACHAVWPEAIEERVEAYARVTRGSSDSNSAAVAWLKHCEVTFEREKELVTRVIDERQLGGCKCSAWLLDGRSPWEGFVSSV